MERTTESTIFRMMLEAEGLYGAEELSEGGLTLVSQMARRGLTDDFMDASAGYFTASKASSADMLALAKAPEEEVRAVMSVIEESIPHFLDDSTVDQVNADEDARTTATKMGVASRRVTARFATEAVSCAGCASRGEWLIDGVAAWCPNCGGSVRPKTDREIETDNRRSA